MDEVDKKIKTALSNEGTRRASVDLGKKTDRIGNSKIHVVEISGESQGKRKIQEFSGVGVEIAKKGRIRGGVFPRLVLVGFQKIIKMDREWQRLLISPTDHNEDN